jgi:hypothetical protein
LVGRRDSAAGKELADEVWNERSHVLDLLNATFVASYAKGEIKPVELFERDGVGFNTADLSLTVESTASATLVPAGSAEGDSLILVTDNGQCRLNRAKEPAWLNCEFGRMTAASWSVRCGLASTRLNGPTNAPDVRQTVKHAQAPVFERFPGDAAQSFSGCRYWARLQLGNRLRVRRIELRKIRPEPTLIVLKASCYDAVTSSSQPFLLEHKLPFTESTANPRWQVVQERDGVLIVRNNRALQRAWLVPQVKQVTADEALRRIQGTAETDFDPRREALIETETAAQFHNISEASLLPGEEARVTSYEPSRLVVETSAERPRFLVISEISYPGWVVKIDQQPATLFITDYLLRGLVIPAGKHQIELRYHALGARQGALISLLTLLLLFTAWRVSSARQKLQ